MKKNLIKYAFISESVYSHMKKTRNERREILFRKIGIFVRFIIQVAP